MVFPSYSSSFFETQKIPALAKDDGVQAWPQGKTEANVCGYMYI